MIEVKDCIGTEALTCYANALKIQVSALEQEIDTGVKFAVNAAIARIVQGRLDAIRDTILNEIKEQHFEKASELRNEYRSIYKFFEDRGYELNPSSFPSR